MLKKNFSLIELLMFSAQFLCDFAKKAITVFADAKNVITRKFLEGIEGVRGRKGEPFLKKVSLSCPAPFTLIELLIVIAIIGILFIVLVSKVDFATDKAKATGVQTDFRSFQVAFDMVAKENAGFNTFGWDVGDNAGAIPSGYAFVDEAAKNATIADGKRNSYDEGDKNLNGTHDTGETFTGRKIYTETWEGKYSLKKPGTDTYRWTACRPRSSAA